MSMSALDAAIQVLREAGKPLRVEQITEIILARGLWETSGKTPAATVGARIYSDIKKNGTASSFILHAPNTFDLRDAKSIAEPIAEKAERGKYSFTNSAEKVLDKFGEKRPMHYRDITDKAIEKDWIATEGKTPEATMYAQILTEIKRRKQRGEQPRFVLHGKGLVGLARWMERGLTFDIEQHNKKVRKALHEQLSNMEWYKFEELIARLLVEMGFENVEITSRGNDKGIDVRGTLSVGDVIRTQMAIQVKRWKDNVQSKTVREVRGSLNIHEQGLIITTSDFRKGAREEATRPGAVPVALMNGKQLVALLIENEIGAKRQSYDLIDLDDEDTSISGD